MDNSLVQVSDPAALSSLHQWLDRAPGVDVQRTSAPPAPGEQGAWEMLTVLASSGGVLAVAVRTLPEYFRSRRSTVTPTVKAKGREITLTASNVAELVPVIEKALTTDAE